MNPNQTPNKGGRPHKLTTKEIETLAAEYFKEVDQSGRMPTISGLSLKLGVDIQTIRNWAKGDVGLERGYLAVTRKVLAQLAGYWEPLLATVKGNTSGVQFWLKSVLAWRDSDPRETKTELTTGDTGVKVTITSTGGAAGIDV